ncbi:hypothetical protein ANRL3_00227 [Anaerolineae bacterium]|nr:hypothetical protein ANRL3_00227 [Anaerolineae bacterium]
MKLRLVIVLMVAVFSSLVVVTGGSTAHPVSLDNIVYLPIVANSCITHQVGAYLSASRPVISTGESITVTGAVVSDGCPFVGAPIFYVYSDPTGILQPAVAIVVSNPHVPPSKYREVSATFMAVGEGPVTFTLSISYMTSDLPWNFADSSPIVVRVLPNP